MNPFRWNPFRKANRGHTRALTAEDHLAPGTPFNPNNFSPWHGFRHLTPAVIAGLQDQDIHRAVSNHFRLKEAEAERLGLRLSRQSFTREVLLLHAIWILEAEVRNGGFGQYFHNHDAQVVRDAIDGLRMIDALPSLDSLHEAIGLFSHVHSYLLPVIEDYGLSRPSERPEFETATHEFHVRQDDLNMRRAKFMRSMSAAQLACGEASEA
jgi:hypothetical protein